MAHSLDGKVAVVTGGRSGIGLATAKRLVEEGASVFIVGRRQEELNRAVGVIGGGVSAVQGNVARPGDLDRLYQQVAAQAHGLDIVVATRSRAPSSSTASRTSGTAPPG